MKKESRRHVRELAMQALYFIDTVHGKILGDVNGNQSDNINNSNSNGLSQENTQVKSTLLKKGIRKKKASNKSCTNVIKNINNDLNNKQEDLNPNDPLKLLDDFWTHFSDSIKSKSFFMQLTKGVIDYRTAIDVLIEKFSNNWKISRMSCVDRNIMRIAVFELLHCDDIPPKVSINEAVDIGKNFGTDDSGPFINGILDSIRIAIDEKKI